ncbi:MarR family winged helix-turn-helix transcriptional regulator [Paenarthrobacter sp. NPDC057981]|uniref:MarR family winged helix-turn-helix transcriptional regulator n=1 Tax=Paenarthrobacter sp. NPDC057981 TaxID=3346297 RepID=UPI0036DE818A
MNALGQDTNAATYDSSPKLPPRVRQSSLDGDIEFLAARARSVGNAAANGELAPLDLKVRSYAVLALASTTDGPSQREIAEYLCLDPSRIVAIVDELEQRDLVRRTPDPRDRRTKVVRSTKSGQALYRLGAEAVRKAEEFSLRALSFDERNTLRELLRKIAFTE